MKIKYSIAVLSSALLFLLTSWSYSYCLSASWIGSICYFTLTIILLRQYDDGQYTKSLVWCVIAGRLLAECPVDIICNPRWLDTFFVTVATISSIVLAALYSHYRSGVVLMLVVIIMILMNTLGYDAWSQLVSH